MRNYIVRITFLFAEGRYLFLGETCGSIKKKKKQNTIHVFLITEEITPLYWLQQAKNRGFLFSVFIPN